MFKIRNKKVRTFLTCLMSAALMFNSQHIATYSAPTEEILEVVTVEEDIIEEVVVEEPVTIEVTSISEISAGIEPVMDAVVVEENIIEEVVVEEIVEENYILSSEEIDLLAIITMAEAEGECEYGQRLVIDTILNRMDSSKFPDTVRGVIYQKNQFECTWNGRVDRCYVKDDIRQLVIEELTNRTNYDVMFFRGGCYSSYGTPMFQVENHYFNSL